MVFSGRKIDKIAIILVRDGQTILHKCIKQNEALNALQPPCCRLVFQYK